MGRCLRYGVCFLHCYCRLADVTTAPVPPIPPHPPPRFQDKVFPLLLHHNLPDVFSYRHCSFRVQKSKAGTGRVGGFKEMGMVNRCGWG